MESVHGNPEPSGGQEQDSEEEQLSCGLTDPNKPARGRNPVFGINTTPECVEILHEYNYTHH